MRQPTFVALGLLLVYLLLNIVKPYNILNRYSSINGSDVKWEFSFDKWKDTAAYPWLFEHPRQRLLFASMCNDLDGLLSIMSNKTNKIALLRFNYAWQIILQNNIYTLVKFGEVYNYIVMVGDEKSLKVCIEMNLPCFNGTFYYTTYYKDIDPTVGALFNDSKHYQPMVWFKLRFYLDVLLRNYTIISSDTDIAFSRKNIWLSLEKYSKDVGYCDMIFMIEHPVNTGFFYCKSNPDTIALFQAWINTQYSYPYLNDQDAFGVLKGKKYDVCDTKDQCDKIKQTEMVHFNQTDQNTTKTYSMVSLRTFPSSYKRYSKSFCPTTEKMDPCVNTTFFVHPICKTGQTPKAEVMKNNGFWMMKEPCNKTTLEYQLRQNDTVVLDIYRCSPKIFEDINNEKEFEKCQNTTAWTD